MAKLFNGLTIYTSKIIRYDSKLRPLFFEFMAKLGNCLTTYTGKINSYKTSAALSEFMTKLNNQWTTYISNPGYQFPEVAHVEQPLKTS